MGRLVSGLLFALALAALPATRAEAQYRSYTFGFEGGYQALTTGLELKQNNVSFGLFGGYKLADHWWFSGRAQLSFPGELRTSATTSPNTVVLFHLVPISVQYYFLTDAFRPYVSLTNAFEFLINSNTSQSVYWGPGAGAGLEIKVARDIFLGIKVDGFMMLRFDLPAAVVMASGQLVFFL